MARHMYTQGMPDGGIPGFFVKGTNCQVGSPFESFPGKSMVHSGCPGEKAFHSADTPIHMFKRASRISFCP